MPDFVDKTMVFYLSQGKISLKQAKICLFWPVLRVLLRIVNLMRNDIITLITPIREAKLPHHIDQEVGTIGDCSRPHYTPLFYITVQVQISVPQSRLSLLLGLAHY